MSVNVYLNKPDGSVATYEGEAVRGGTYALMSSANSGPHDCWLNVTYNYGEVYAALLGDRYPGMVEFFNGKTVAEVLPLLRELVARSPKSRPFKDNYWAPTIGNALEPIRTFIAWSEQYPDGRWEANG